MVIHFKNKIDSRLTFTYRQKRFLHVPLRRLLCNAMIQPFFDYACNAWYPNVSKKLKMRLPAAQNKCIKFGLKLNDICSIKSKDLKKMNLLLIHERLLQCSLCSVYKFFKKNSPNYFDEINVPIETNEVQTFIIPKIKCSSSKSKFWKKSFILCWYHTLKQFKGAL